MTESQNIKFECLDVPGPRVKLKIRCPICKKDLDISTVTFTYPELYMVKCPRCSTWISANLPTERDRMTSLHDEYHKDETCDDSHPGATKDWENGDPKRGCERITGDVTISLKDKGHAIKKSERFNAGKVPLHYLMMFPTAIEAFSRVCEGGTHKYNYLNFLNGGKHWSEAIDSCLRHIKNYVRWCIWQEAKIDIGSDGEPNMFASDTGCHHLAHAMWNLMFEIDMNTKGHAHDPELFEKMCKFWQSVKGLPWDTITSKLSQLQNQTNEEMAS